MSLLLLSLKPLIKYGPFRIDAHNPNLTLPFFQVPTRPRDRPARSNSTDEHVQLPSSLIMCQGIHPVHILIGHETIGRLPSQSFSNSNVVLWRIWQNICGCYNDVCSEGSEQRSLLLAHLVRHREDHLVTLHRRGHRQTHSGISTRRLDYSPARLHKSLLLRCLNHCDPYSVLHAAAWIQALKLQQHDRLHILRDLVQPDKRCVAYQSKNTIIILHNTDRTCVRTEY